MTDPIVHITNGVPDAGTGNITTLGQTLVDGANFTLGSSTDLAPAAGAVGTMNGHLRAISRDLAGGIVLQAGGNTIGSVNQGTSPWVVSGTVGVSGTVTVSGTVAATQSGLWNINNISGTITLPSGAATAAKQPALGLAGTPSTDVLTVQGATSMVPLKVDGSAVTQPISGNVGIVGTVNAAQSGTWNVGITGTVSVVQGGNFTTRIVGNSGNTIDFPSTQNQSTPASSLLVGGEFNTVPTTISNGNSSPLQLDSSANLLVNVKTGAVSATQSGTWSVRTQDGSGNALTSATRGAQQALSVQIVDGSGNQITTFGGAGGTSSNLNSAVPTAGTAAGFSDGSNMQMARVFDGDSGAGIQYSLGVLLKTPASGGAVDIGVAGQPLRVDPTGTTVQPVSGTVTANQGGTWNITNVSGTVSLPTGAATSANQPSAAGAASSTSGQTGNLSMGAVSTSAPTYTNATSNFLSLTTAGALRVDGSAVTQPVSGTFWQTTQPVSIAGTVNVSAAQSGTWSVRTQDGSGNALTSAARGTQQALSVQIVDGSGNQITSFGGSGGTASNYGSTFPTSGTASGYSDGTNMQGARVFDADSGAGTQYVLGVSLRKTASGGSVDFGTSTDPIRTDPTGTTTQPISGTVTAQQGGAPWTVKPDNTAWALTGTSANVNVTNTVTVSGTVAISGTVAATQSGTWNITNISGTVSLPTGAATAANQPTAAALGSSTSGQTGNLSLGAVSSTAPSYTTATTNALSLTPAGALRTDSSAVTQPVSGSVGISGTVACTQSGTWNITNISGTVSLPTGAATSANQPSNAGAASTTSGQTGNLSMGAVTSAAPTYTTATTNYLSLTLAGALRVDGSSTTQPVSGTVTVAQATAANLNATVTGTVGATQSGTWTVQQGTPPWLVGGDIAAGSADSGNPAKIGGVARTANPTAVANGQRVNASFDKLGKQVVIGALRETKGDQKTSITTTTETTVVTAGGAGVFNDIYGIVVTNKSATTVFVDFRDSTGGAVVTTLAAPANDTRGLTLTVDSAITQTTAANNWTAQLSSATTSVEITMLFVACI